MEAKTILWIILVIIGITFIIAIIVFFKKFFSSAPANSSGNAGTSNSLKKTFSNFSLKSILIWGARIGLTLIVLWMSYSLYLYFKNYGKEEEKENKTETREMLDLQWQKKIYPGQILTTCQINWDYKFRANGHDYDLKFPGVDTFTHFYKEIEEYDGPTIESGSTIQVRAGKKEKEPFTINLYKKALVEVTEN